MADILCFPLNRAVGRARHVADLWLQKSGRDREVYWSNTVRRMTGVLQRVGLSDDEIAVQIDAFQRAVQVEVDFAHSILSHDTNHKPPHGAA